MKRQNRMFEIPLLMMLGIIALLLVGCSSPVFTCANNGATITLENNGGTVVLTTPDGRQFRGNREPAAFVDEQVVLDGKYYVFSKKGNKIELWYLLGSEWDGIYLASSQGISLPSLTYNDNSQTYNNTAVTDYIDITVNNNSQNTTLNRTGIAVTVVISAIFSVVFIRILINTIRLHRVNNNRLGAITLLVILLCVCFYLLIRYLPLLF